MSHDLVDFEGRTRVFPLPNVVLFPGMLLPLHVFENRYREMLADAIDDDNLITIALLKPGFEQEYEDRPAMFDIGCIGRILEHEMLEDGRSNLILQGLARVQIVKEIVIPGQSYRTAQVTVHHDSCASDAHRELITELSDQLTLFLERLGRPVEPEKAAEFRHLSLASICDLAASCLPCEIDVKQGLLEELSPVSRSESVLAWLRKVISAHAGNDGRGDFHHN